MEGGHCGGLGNILTAVSSILTGKGGDDWVRIKNSKRLLVNDFHGVREDKANGNGTFDFLGFTHYWEKSRRGCWIVKRKTAKKRFRRTVKALKQWCRRNRLLPLKEQYRVLCLKIQGHYQYYGIRGNYRMLARIPHYVRRAWQYWLSRRSHKGYISGKKFQRLMVTFSFPKPRIIHNI